MTKAELITEVSSRAGLSRHQAARAVSDILSTIFDALSRGEKVLLVDIGTLEVIKRPACRGRNPQTGETVCIPARKTIRFKAAKAMKEVVNH